MDNRSSLSLPNLKKESETDVNVSVERWKVAQESEKDFWGSFRTEEIRRNHEEAYKREIKEFKKRWSKFISLNKKTRVLQIGCGPLDIINYLDFGEKHSVDPLAEFYKKRFNFDYVSSNLVSSPGESLPFEDNFFDLVILSNVLDHTKNPDKVLMEARRVLKKEGILHFECAYYQEGFLMLAKIYGPIKKIFSREIFNIHHPHMFSLKDLRNLILEHFKTYNENRWERVSLNIYNKTDMMNFLKNQKITRKIPALFGLYGNINYSAICKKN